MHAQVCVSALAAGTLDHTAKHAVPRNAGELLTYVWIVPDRLLPCILMHLQIHLTVSHSFSGLTRYIAHRELHNCIALMILSTPVPTRAGPCPRLLGVEVGAACRADRQAVGHCHPGRACPGSRSWWQQQCPERAWASTAAAVYCACHGHH